MKIHKIARFVCSSVLMVSAGLALSGFTLDILIDTSSETSEKETQTELIGQGKCADIVGNWSWDARRFSVELQPDGTVDGYDGGELIGGRWSCEDPQLGAIKVVWDTGFTDTGFLSGAGQTLNLVNNTGSRFDAIRR